MTKPTQGKRGGYSGGPASNDPSRRFWLIFAVGVAAFVVGASL
jgi:hypothetical protein